MSGDSEIREKHESQGVHESQIVDSEKKGPEIPNLSVGKEPHSPYDNRPKRDRYDWATLAISLLTFVALVYYARQANIQAEATKTAANAAKLSADASVANSRAWVVFAKYDVLPPSGIADMYIENPGKTPAVNLRAAAESIFVANGPSIQFHECPPSFFLKEPLRVEGERYSVGVSNVPSVLRPGESHLIQLGVDLTPEQRALVTQIPPSQTKGPLKELYLHVCLYYRDVIDGSHEHLSESCIQYFTEVAHPCSTGNSVR